MATVSLGLYRGITFQQYETLNSLDLALSSVRSHTGQRIYNIKIETLLGGIIEGGFLFW